MNHRTGPSDWLGLKCPSLGELVKWLSNTADRPEGSFLAQQPSPLPFLPARLH